MTKYIVEVVPIIDVFDIEIECDCTPRDIIEEKCEKFQEELKKLREEIEFQIGTITKIETVVISTTK
jgi:DNA-directed RNA polymerase subunit L